MSQLSATSIGVGSEDDRITAITIPCKVTNRMWSVKMRGSMWMFVGVFIYLFAEPRSIRDQFFGAEGSIKIRLSMKAQSLRVFDI